MNTNLLHNVLNLVSALLGAMAVYDWSSFGLPAATIAMIMGVISFAKLAVNVFRDGFAGLAKAQPPVK